MEIQQKTNYNDDENEDNIFINYTQTKNGGMGNLTNNLTNHVIFDPINKFNEINEAKMDKHLTQHVYSNITPWRTLLEIISIPVVMLALLVTININIFFKIILIFLIIIHIIISTCLVSFLSKNNQQILQYNNQIIQEKTNQKQE